MNPALSTTGKLSAAALIASARAHLDDGQHAAAVSACEKALQVDPACADTMLMLGLISFEMDQPAQALAFLNQAQARRPDAREYADALAVVHTRIGNVSEGLFFAKLATTLEPDETLQGLLPPRYSNFFKSVEQSQPNRFRGRAEFLMAHGHIAAAITACEKQLELTPEDIETKRILASAVRREGHTSRAITIGKELLRDRTPERCDTLELARSLSDAGLFRESRAVFNFLIDRWGEDPSVESERIASEIRDPEATAESVRRQHEDWASRFVARQSGAPFPNERNDRRPLRIGYLCRPFDLGDFNDLVAPVICRHGTSGNQAYIYTEGPPLTAADERVRRHIVKWTDIRNVDHETTAQILRGDGIDIAVDLTTHGDGYRGLTVARRPAPVVFSWQSDPFPPAEAVGTPLVADGMCHELSDQPHLRILAPFTPPTTAPDVDDLPARRLGYVTFGAKLDLTSIGPSTASVWSNLLVAVPGSRLLIANATDKDDDCIERCVSQFSHFGMRGRVDIINIAENFRDALEFYNHVDVALDGYPVSQLAELYRAMWMGVPVLSLAGRDNAPGAAALRSFGAPDWTASNLSSFVEAGKRLTADLTTLSTTRSTLRQRMQQSIVSDIDSFTQELEAVFRSAWSDWCSQTD